MKTRRLAITLGLAALVTSLLIFAAARVKQPAAPEKNPPAAAGEYRISGPHTHENLTVFLVHGPERLSGKVPLTLQEALERKQVIVHETSNVNELTIENVSPTEEVFVQAGDIVKGGRQDRCLTVDLILPPKSGKVPIAAYCVEQGRWSQRGREAAANFSSSDSRLATKDLKIAGLGKGKSQGEVWSKVEEAQVKLSANAGASARAAESPSSLQLTLENKQVQQLTDGYIKSLAAITERQPDVIGYAFAINGKINSADVYGSVALFQKLWPKLLRASAVEAVAELQKGAPPPEPVTAEMIATFLAQSEQGRPAERSVTERVKNVVRETDQHLLLEAHDLSKGGRLIHRNYLKK